MVSDVRKQARLNQEVVQLKQELAQVCKSLKKENFNKAFSMQYGVNYNNKVIID